LRWALAIGIQLRWTAIQASDRVGSGKVESCSAGESPAAVSIVLAIWP